MIEKDYKYEVMYTTVDSYHCEEYGCDDEGICRCGKIDGVNIISADLNAITQSIHKQIFESDSTKYKRDQKINQILYNTGKSIDVYCINRLLVINKLYDPDKWDASITGGYYGEEISNISIESRTFTNLEKDIENILNMQTLKEKIEFLLIKEYGSILPAIKGKENYTHQNIDREKLIIGNKRHLNNVEKKSLDFYSDNKYVGIIRGIAFEDNGYWRLIDGYHRVSKTDLQKINLITIS